MRGFTEFTGYIGFANSLEGTSSWGCSDFRIYRNRFAYSDLRKLKDLGNRSMASEQRVLCFHQDTGFQYLRDLRIANINSGKSIP